MSHRRFKLLTSIAVLSATTLACPANAQILIIEDLFDQLNDLTSVVTLNGQAILNNSNALISIDADVSVLSTEVTQIQVDLDANEALDVVQSGQITAIDGRLTTVEAQTGINTGAIAALDVRLDINDALDATQTTQIATLDGRVTVVETQTGLNTGAIAALDTRLTANDARDDGQDARLDGHDTELASLDQRLTFNDARDDGQALLLVEHDLRIGTAQVTANAAAADAANLRSAIVAGQIGLVQQASPSAPITVGATTGGDYVSFAGQAGDRRLGGIAAGVNANDAVNLSQVQLADAAILDQARAYTDTSLANLGFDLGRLTQLVQYNERELRREIQAASAGAAALAGLPQAILPGKGIVAIGLGGRGSNTAFAIGVGKAFNSPNTPVLRAGAAIDARRGDVTYNAAVGFHF